MKIKKVEISAFRVYNNQSDATFDFTINSGEPADFISLYAPNGFGKTSFYDAVEWAMTNDVQRFWQNDDITNEAIAALRDINDERQLKVLRNRDAADNVETSVDLITDNDIHFERKFSVHGNSSSDISGVLENKDFQRVILSQEWISAFLKENKGDKRYEKFMENPELAGLDEYFKKVKALVAACDKNINDLGIKINELKQNITELDDQNFLEKVNLVILSLKERNELLDMISITTTDKEVLSFNDKITERLLDIQKVINGAKSTIDSIAASRSGNEKISGVDIYYQNLTSYSDIIKEIDRLEHLTNRFAQQEKNKTEYASKILQRGKVIETLNELDVLIKNYDKFEDIYKLNENINKEISEAQNLLTNLIQQNSQKNVESSNLQLKLESNFKKLTEANTFKERVPIIKKDLDLLAASIISIGNEIEKLHIERLTKLKDREDIELYINNYEIFMSAIEAQNYSISIPVDFELENVVLSDLSDLSKSILEIQQEIADIDSKLGEQEIFNSAVKDLISKGIEIVNISKSSICPLCTYEYDSYTLLAERIAGNKLLDVSIQVLLTQKTNTQNRQLELEVLRSEKNDEIINRCQNIKNESQIKLSNASNDLEQLDLSIEAKSAQRGGLQEESLLLQEQLNGNNLAEHEKKIDDLIIALQNERNEQLRLTNLLAPELGKLDDEIKRVNVLIKNKEDNIAANEGDKNYTLLSNWFTNNIQASYGDKSIIVAKVGELNSKNNTLNAAIEELQKIINKEDEELSPYSSLSLESLTNSSTSFKERLMVSISGYELFLKNELNIIASGTLKDKLLDILNEQENLAKANIKDLTLLGEDYSKLAGYSKNLLPFLQSEVAKADLKNSENDKQFLAETTKPYLEKERNSIKAFLEQKIKSFFYEELINNIYNKIDPHPDFKGVDFRVDLDSDNPRLDILVTNTKNKKKIIPNLYFSTAQINILSISIFLASALNTTEYDCIFVDDPIQSMDSINVLSTIDLLRGIVTTGKKQIVLSTHDENFHSLLKKKMPPDLFKSKFLELETFGKVKN